MKYCPECGKELIEGMKFCGECGFKITANLQSSVMWEDTSPKLSTQPATSMMIKMLLAIFGIGSIIIGSVFLLMWREGWGEFCMISGEILIILGIMFIFLIYWYSQKIKAR